MQKQIVVRRQGWTPVPALVPVAVIVLLAGCSGLRFAPGEPQKQNAWLHNRTAQVAAEAARAEATSPTLQALTQLSELQSRAFVADYGLPKEFPPAETAEQILDESNWQLARSATADSTGRPDAWQLADAALEVGIALSALLGGVYGTKCIRFLQEARAKTQALREIITGNELFKKQNADSVPAFKAAQAQQSPETRQLVTQMKPA